jgi:hypothetical protein
MSQVTFVIAIVSVSKFRHLLGAAHGQVETGAEFSTWPMSFAAGAGHTDGVIQTPRRKS